MPTGELLTCGVTPDELRGPGWRSPFHGLHAPASGDLLAPIQRILDAVELVPPGGAIGGWAAAHLLGAVELDGRGRSGREEEDVVIVAPRPCHRGRRQGVRFVRSALSDDDRVEVGGVTVTSPIRTVFDLARSRPARDALAGVDCACRLLGLEVPPVQDYLDRHRRYRGIPTARQVLSLADPRSRSAGESRLRYLWVVDARLPRPECNAYVIDCDGRVVAMVDLLDPESGLVGEYDGATHRLLASHTADNAREEDLEHCGLAVVRATSMDLGIYRQRTITRLRAGRERALASRSRSWGWRPGSLPVLSATRVFSDPQQPHGTLHRRVEW